MKLAIARGVIATRGAVTSVMYIFDLQGLISLSAIAQCAIALVIFIRSEHAGSVPKFHSAAAQEIGRRVRRAREACEISLEDLGHLSEINWTTIGKIERGVSSPTVESLIRIADALEVDPGSFITGISADDYGEREHQLTAREFIAERQARVRRR